MFSGLCECSIDHANWAFGEIMCTICSSVWSRRTTLHISHINSVTVHHFIHVRYRDFYRYHDIRDGISLDFITSQAIFPMVSDTNSSNEYLICIPKSCTLHIHLLVPRLESN